MSVCFMAGQHRQPRDAHTLQPPQTGTLRAPRSQSLVVSMPADMFSGSANGNMIYEMQEDPRRPLPTAIPHAGQQ